MVTGRGVCRPFLALPTVVHADASVGPGRAKVDSVTPLNPVCPAGVLLLPAEEAGAACSTEPLRPAWGAAACGGGCGVVGATSEPRHSAVPLMQCCWRHL
jgi:hypothetical protein